MNGSQHIRRAVGMVGTEPAKIVAYLAGHEVDVTRNLVRQVLKNERRAKRKGEEALQARKARPNRSAAIRVLLDQRKTAVEIREILKRQGIEVTLNLIDTVRKQDKRRKRKHKELFERLEEEKKQLVKYVQKLLSEQSRSKADKALRRLWHEWLGILPEWDAVSMAEHHGACEAEEVIIAPGETVIVRKVLEPKDDPVSVVVPLNTLKDSDSELERTEPEAGSLAYFAAPIVHSEARPEIAQPVVKPAGIFVSLNTSEGSEDVDDSSTWIVKGKKSQAKAKRKKKSRRRSTPISWNDSTKLIDLMEQFDIQDDQKAKLAELQKFHRHIPDMSPKRAVVLLKKHGSLKDYRRSVANE